MVNNNVQNIKFLRNGSLFATREAARTALNEFELTYEKDGTAILARYGSDDAVKTLVGWVYANNSGNESITIFDIDDAGTDVDEKIKTAIKTEIDKLNYTDSAVSGQYVSQVSQADGKIAVSRVDLPSLEEVKVTGKPIVAVSENKGQVAASVGTINAEYVNVTGSVFTSSTVQAALAEIDTAYKAADTAIIGGASASANTLGEIEGIINQIKTDEKTYTIEEITSGLESNVRKAYKLVDEDGTQSGATIEIYKDSSLQSVELVNEDPTQKPAKKGQFLKFTYITDSETTDVVYLDVSTFLVEAEFKDGLQTKNGEVSIKLDTNGDDTGDGKFLTVGANGLKLDGVTDAIGTAISGLYVSDTAVAGQYVSQISETDGKIAVVRANVSEAVLNNYSKGSTSGAVASTDTVNQAISKLENQVDAAKSAATTVVAEGTDAGNNMSIIENTGADGHKIFTVNLSDVASAQGLANEIAARKDVDGQNGDTYAANVNANYISSANSLNDADVKLDAALKVVDGAMLTGVTAGNGITVSDKGSKSQTISVKVKNDNGIVNDGTGLHLGYIDAGVYDAN